MRRLGLRGRLALAFVGAAVLAVALTTLIGNLGFAPRLNAAARSRLDGSARHVEVASAVYLDEGGFTPTAQQTLAHLAALGGLRLSIRKTGGGLVVVGAPPRGATGEAPIVARGRCGEIRGVAERLERGQLEARVEPRGDSEIRAVARALNRLAETLEHEEEIRKASVADLGHELRTPSSNPTSPKSDVALEPRSRRASRTPASPFAVEAEPVLVKALTPADSSRLLRNLRSNALRYTEAGGTVILRVGAGRVAWPAPPRTRAPSSTWWRSPFSSTSRSH